MPQIKNLFMVDLSSVYMGLKLKTPIIIGSSGLTKSVEKIKEFEEKGAGAVVLKSLFEEQIMHDSDMFFQYPESYNNYPEAIDYIKNITEESSVNDYLNLIKEAKKSVSIPIIASINCVSLNEWVSIAKDIEHAGADALELNIFIMPDHIELDGAAHEKMYFEIIEKVKSHIKIPLAIKVGYYFSGLVNTIQRFSWTGVKAIVMFNRFFSPDINLKTMKLQPANIFSTPDELPISLRWVAMVSGKVQCDISASTGIHDGSAVIKQLLVGAKTTQVCSAIYKKGPDIIVSMIDDLKIWMEKNNFKTIDEFRGKFSVKKTENPVLYHRVQYMKHLSNTE